MADPQRVFFGAGGHCKVVLDAAQRMGRPPGLLLDDSPLVRNLLGVPVVAFSEVRNTLVPGFEFVVAIGNNQARRMLFEQMKALGGIPTVVIHPFSSVAASAVIGAGTVLMAGVVVNPYAVIGENSIVNTSASVDHDCRLAAHTHICPGVRLAGSVTVGEETMIGTGASVIPGIRIGARVIVGAGGVVVRDLPDDVVAMGSPARARNPPPG